VKVFINFEQLLVLSAPVHWVTEMESGLHEINHYLDDFLFAGADKTSNCSKLMNTEQPMVRHLSIKYQLPILNPSKSNSP
jgi:hypothetical protein